MTVGQPKYDDDQRRAIEHARLSRGLPASAIVALAREGELPKLDGASLEPFEIKIQTVYSIAREANRRASRVRSSALVKQPREEALSALWDRMVEVADRETQRLVDRSRRKPNEPVDAEQLRKMARFQRELEHIGKPSDRPKPGAGGNATRTESPTADKAALAILQAAKGGPIEAAPADLPLNAHVQGQRMEGSSVQSTGEGQGQSDGHADGQGEETPGSRAADAISALLVQSVTSPSEA